MTDDPGITGGCAKGEAACEPHGAMADGAVRLEALDPARSFIVQAPAGSGKTTLLIQRFLCLLSRVSRPEELLAITFTRKAAAEMHGRIFEALVAANSGAQGRDENEERTLLYARAALKRNRELDWGLLLNSSRLQVQTIDSFCAKLSGRLPLMSKLGANLSVTQDSAVLYAKAARQTVKLIDGTGAEAEAMRQVLLYHDNSIVDVEQKLITMLGKREQWLRHTGNLSGTGELRAMLEGSVERLVQDKLSQAAALFSTELVSEIIRLARYAASNLCAENTNSPITALKDMKGLPGCNSGFLQQWRGLADLLVTQEDEWRKPGGVNKRLGFPPDKKKSEAVENKQGFKVLLALLSTDNELLEALKVVRALPDAAYTEEDWKTLQALLQLLPAALQRLRELFREERTVDFAEVSMAAIKALGTDENPTDLMLALDNTYSHILVDEYQDTSWTQVTLLKALTRGFEPGDGRTLFIVGDPMQSIYLFRDTEVGLFLAARDPGGARTGGFETVELVPLTLRSNFRSDGHIVGWVNGTFAGAMPEVEDPLTGAVVYEESVAYRSTDAGAAVTPMLFAGSKEAWELEEAKEVVRVVQGLNAADPLATKAVLFRSRSHVKCLVAALKNAGIDFKADELDPLAERAVVQDLLALTGALFYPADRVAWLSVLRARWCGLTLSELHALCVNDFSSPVLELIRDSERIALLGEESTARLARFRTAFDFALGLRYTCSPRSLLEGLWVALNGPACYEEHDSVAHAELFFEMLDSVSVGGGLTSITALEERIGNLYAQHSGEGENPLALMTIHKAKGLEFDHVILPGLGRKPRSSDRRLLYWMERGDDLILAPIEKKHAEKESLLFRYLKEVQSRKERLEAARLFYVAVTRAKKRLYLFGHVTKFEDGLISLESTSLLDTIKGSLDPGMVVELETQEEVAVAKEAPALKRLAPAWRPPDTVGAAGAPGGAEPEKSGERPKYDWATVTASYVGTAVHRFFARIATEGLQRWGNGRLEKERGRMEAELLSLGIGKKEVGRVAGKGLALVANALSDKEGRWVLGEQKESGVEWALSGMVEGGVEEVVIDRTFVDNDGVRWIVDYKTGRHEGSSVEGFLAGERLRYAPQLEKYAAMLRLYGERRVIKKALYYPALKRLVVL